MPLHEVEAIVLRHYSLSDSDRIIVLMTREHGKERAVAKGVKKPQSRIAGCLEPLNHVRLELYVREGRDLGQIRRAELIHSYLGKNPSLTHISAFDYFAEICNEIVPDNQVNYPLFRLILATLDAGEKKGIQSALVRYFEIWCLKLSGLLPNYAYCSSCGKCVKDDEFFAWVEAGQARCKACADGRGLKIGSPAAAALDAMTRLSPEQFVNLPPMADAVRDIGRLANGLLNMHLEKQLKSYRILEEALQTL
ncbi:MAG: DNA repair protein RecO [Acidobacteria bacterium]|nr:DNA repair protein RecO [Acidobacteriota bacterium]